VDGRFEVPVVEAAAAMARSRSGVNPDRRPTVNRQRMRSARYQFHRKQPAQLALIGAVDLSVLKGTP
jgi:hypothetical protein